MTDLITEQLDDLNSYFHRAQRLSVQHQEETERNAMKSKAKNEGVTVRKSCVMISPDTPSAIDSLILVADSLSPERKASKNVLLRRLEDKFFLPSSPSRNNDTTSDTVDPIAVASHVEGGLRVIAQIFDLPAGEADILMSELGDLKTIATADDSLLETIPIDNLTRKILHDFFGSADGNSGKVSRQIQTSEPHFSLERALFPEHTNTYNLTDVAAQLFPHSNSSRRPNIQVEPNGVSVYHSSPARSQEGTHSQLQQQQYLDPITVDESWADPIDVEETYHSSFDAGDDEFVDGDNTHLGTQGSPFSSSSAEKYRSNSNMPGRRNPLVEKDGNASQFSSMSHFASPPHATGYENSQATRASQAYPVASRSHPQNKLYFQRDSQQYQSEQLEFPNDYSPSRFPNLHGDRSVSISRQQDVPPNMEIFSPRKTNHQWPPRYQQLRYYDRNGFER